MSYDNSILFVVNFCSVPLPRGENGNHMGLRNSTRCPYPLDAIVTVVVRRPSPSWCDAHRRRDGCRSSPYCVPSQPSRSVHCVRRRRVGRRLLGCASGLSNIVVVVPRPRRLRPLHVFPSLMLGGVPVGAPALFPAPAVVAAADVVAAAMVGAQVRFKIERS
jgi:hypothetical protein